jgi:hypothetical protein
MEIGPDYGYGRHILIGSHPIRVVLVERSALNVRENEPEAHYSMEDLTPLIESGRAQVFDSETLRAISRALEWMALK